LFLPMSRFSRIKNFCQLENKKILKKVETLKKHVFIKEN